jgi:hypothetical protein
MERPMVQLRQKIRALISDFNKKSTEVFVYTTSPIFTIAQENITITEVTLNGDTSGVAYTFSSVTNKLTFTDTLLTNDVIEVSYTYNKYSDDELDEYIRAALVFISVYSYDPEDYVIASGDELDPTPTAQMNDLICLVAALLIKPDWTAYKLPNVSVVYGNSKLTKEEKIEKLVTKYTNCSIGVTDTLNFDLVDFNSIAY